MEARSPRDKTCPPHMLEGTQNPVPTRGDQMSWINQNGTWAGATVCLSGCVQTFERECPSGQGSWNPLKGRHSCLSPFWFQEDEEWISLGQPWGGLDCLCVKGNVSSPIESFPLFLRRKEWYKYTHCVRLLKACHLGEITKRFQGKKEGGRQGQWVPEGTLSSTP